MTTRRELIVQQVIGALALVPGVTGVYRSREDALTRDDAPALVVRPIREEPRAVTHAYVEKDLLLSVAVYTRAVAGDPLVGPLSDGAHTAVMLDAGIGVVSADRAADDICEAVYAALLGDPTRGGLAVDTTDDGTSWELDDADGTGCWTELQVKVWYRHDYASLN